MDSLSKEVGEQFLQKKIDTLIFEMEDTRKKLLQTEDRLETKFRNLLNDMEIKEAKHQEEITHLIKEIKEINTIIGNRSMTDVTHNDEFKEHGDLEGNSVRNQNQLAPSDSDRNNHTVRSSHDGRNIESERSNGPNPLSIQGLSRFSSRFTRLLGSDETNNMHKSDSFHMYSVATISDPSNTCGIVWFVTIISILVTMVQFLILHTLVTEAMNPTCASHQDCRIGEYCDFDVETTFKMTPRCNDCSYVYDYTQAHNISNCSSVLDGYKDMSHTDYADVDHTDIAWKINFDYTDTQEMCFAQLHCNETDLLEDRCDYIVSELNQLHSNQVGILIFMSLLLAVLISKDVQDSIAEERYLNHGLKCGSIKPSSQVAAEVLRMALRARQIVIPWYAASAGISIIITNTLDTQNIMLNLLTIDVILIADDLLATLFLPLFDQSSTEKLVKSASLHSVKVSMIWSRIHGILVASILVLTIYFFEPLIRTFSAYSTARCDEFFGGFIIILLISPLCVSFLHGVGHIALDHKSATKCKAIMRGIGEIILDLVSYAFFSTLAVYISLITQFQDVDAFFRNSVFYGVAFIFCFISLNVAKLYTSWQPIQALSLNLFGM